MKISTEKPKQTTLVVGATPNPARYAFRAVEMLRRYGHDVVAYGLRPGQIGDVAITTEWPQAQSGIHTITLYVGSQNLPPLFEQLLSLNPTRIIFNPGTENAELRKLAVARGIQCEYACTLVMLAVGQYD